jgi:hypothetical protein
MQKREPQVCHQCGFHCEQHILDSNFNRGKDDLKMASYLMKSQALDGPVPRPRDPTKCPTILTLAEVK